MFRRWEDRLPAAYTRDWRKDWQVYRRLEIVRSAYVDLDRIALQRNVNHGSPPGGLHPGSPCDVAGRARSKQLLGRCKSHLDTNKRKRAPGRSPSQRAPTQRAMAESGLPDASFTSLAHVFLTLSATFFGIGM